MSALMIARCVVGQVKNQWKMSATFLDTKHGNTSVPAWQTFSTGLSRQKSVEHQSQIKILETLPSAELRSTRIVFNDKRTCDFKHIWLRDNCRCPECIHPATLQKTLDTSLLDMDIRPRTIHVSEESGELLVDWHEEPKHCSNYDPHWLHKYGQQFQVAKSMVDESVEAAEAPQRPPLTLWDQKIICNHLPEMTYESVMQKDEALFEWIDQLYRFGVAFLRGVPVKYDKIVQVAKRLAYVKETAYGVTFDVISEPEAKSHLAYTGMPLAHHTDMNYREKSPGIQLLHCLRANNVDGDAVAEIGGKSFFVDGFNVANWLLDKHPAAFHVLASTPVCFSIFSNGKRYSQKVPIICLNKDGDLDEIHVNNRTMAPLQLPKHLVMPFYHAYKRLNDKIRDEQLELKFNLVPGDLVIFNNRRILHGRTKFHPAKLSRHLQGCYIDIDEVFSKYDAYLQQY